MRATAWAGHLDLALTISFDRTKLFKRIETEASHRGASVFIKPVLTTRNLTQLFVLNPEK